jgi:hypothetical protein
MAVQRKNGRYRDGSAAACAARGLTRLGQLSGDESYMTASKCILGSLLSPDSLTEGADSCGILQHGALHVPRSRCLAHFGDYYFLETMNSYMNRS